jgi:xylan 1,4-beta-xylosidase
MATGRGVLCGLAGLLSLLMCSVAAAAEAHPNVLFIVTDDMNGYGARKEYAPVWTEQHRFIPYPDGGEELYDRQTDPHEWTNVVSRADMAGVREALARHIPTNWAASVGGRFEQTLPPEVAAQSASLGPGWRPARQAEFRWSNPATNGPAWIRDAYILRVDDRYYMTGTKRISNTEDGPPRWPGFYLWSSDDLQNWREEGCLVSNEQVKWGDRSFWAPEIRWHPARRKFYLCFNVRQSRPEEKLRMGMGLAVADKVTGPYTLLTPDAPLTDNNDTSLFFDDDGKDYVVQTGFNLAQIDLDTLKLVGEKRRVFAGGGAGEWDDVSKINEGSTLLKVNGTYYYFWSCNAWGYFVGYATATNIFGPYTKNPNNPIWGASKPEFRTAARQPADLPVNEVGHGTPFVGPDGRLWISGHGHWIGGGGKYPYDQPRLWFDPLHFDPLTGEFTASFSWTPQTIRYRAGGGAERRAAGEPLGSVIHQLGSKD